MPESRERAIHLSFGESLQLFSFKTFFFHYSSNFPGGKKKTRALSPDPEIIIRMPPASKLQSFPVSRELVRMIRTSSQLLSSQQQDGGGGGPIPLSEHLRAVDARQAKGVEFYLRACALRLEQGL